MPAILGEIIPTSSGFAATRAEYVKGGLHSVDTTTDRDAIPESRRSDGMLVYVRASAVYYRLGADLETWTATAVGGASGVTRNLLDYGMATAGTGAENLAAFQAAVDAADAGDTLFLPPGTYALAPYVNIAKSLSIVGIPGHSRLVSSVAGYSNEGLYVHGEYNPVAATTLSRCHYPGDKTIYVSSTAGLTAGQWILVKDSLALTGWGGGNPVDNRNEDLVRIDSVGAGSIVIHRALTRRYLVTRSASVHAMSTTPPQVVIDGIDLERCRMMLQYCVDSVVTRCAGYASDYGPFGFRYCVGLKLLDCRTETPNDKSTSGSGSAFWFNNCTLCSVRGHTARYCEGAVVRRGTLHLDVSGCLFEGMTTGLGMATGDCRHNRVSDCTFLNSQLVWGSGGHFADSFNRADNCLFLHPPTRCIGAAGDALSELVVTWDGRALKTAAAEHGFDPGQAFILYGTTLPSEITASRRYFAIATTFGGAWGKEWLPSATPARTPAVVTFDAVNHYAAMGDGWRTGDAVVFHALAMPTGLDANRITFLRQASGTNFYLQRRPAQAATFANAANTVTLSSAAGSEWANGDAIMFTGTLPAELTAAPTVYYLRDKTGADTFKVAATAGGAAIDISTDGSGTIYALIGITTAGSGTIHAEGGTPVTMTGSLSNVAVTTIGEGNTFEGLTIQEAPANVFHLHRVGGTRVSDVTIGGNQDATNGVCLFSLASCTDFRVTNVDATNGVDATYNRIAHLSTVFDALFEGGVYALPNSTGQLFTGGTSSNFQVNGLRLPKTTTRAGVFASGIQPAVTRCDGLTLSGHYLSGSPGSVQVVGDASLATAIGGQTGNVIVFGTTLTAARTVDLDNASAVPGDWVEVVRKGAGAYPLTVRNKSDSATLYEFGAAPETGWVRLHWSGSAWVVGASYKA